MSIERVDDLKRCWFPPAGGSFEQAINKALDRIGSSESSEQGQSEQGYVESMVAADRGGRIVKKTKVVKDNVWGMVELEWPSMRLLDSPLLQRLRGIRQLGFTYLTYPSAEHSRFAHSLGMYSVVLRFLDAMYRGRPNYSYDDHAFSVWPLNEESRTDLLHAAILHDTGHMPFSHVVERMLEAFPDKVTCGSYTVQDFKFEAERTLGKELDLSECLSIAIVLSPRFTTYYREFVRPGGEEQSVLRLAALIAGLPPRRRLRGLGDLISGTAVDADKIDYVIRDASACGIPVGIDVARLFLRSSFFDVRRELLPDLYGPNAPPEDTVIFVLNASGVDTVEELTQARSALYQRVYLHQTTRNAERLLGLCFERIMKRASRHRGVNLRDALELWTLDDFGLLRELTSSNDPSVRMLGRRIRNRDLPKRAAVITRSLVTTLVPLTEIFPRMTDGPDRLREIAGVPLDGLRRAVPGKPRSGELTAELRSDLERQIGKEATCLAAQLSGGAVSNLIPAADTPPLISLLPIPPLEQENQHCIVLENNALVSSALRSVSDKHSDAAELFKSVG